MSKFISRGRLRSLKDHCADVRKFTNDDKPFLAIAAVGSVETLLHNFRREGLVAGVETVAELLSIRNCNIEMKAVNDILGETISSETELSNVLQMLKKSKSKHLNDMFLDKLECDFDNATSGLTMDQASTLLFILQSRMSIPLQYKVLEKASTATSQRLGGIVGVLKGLLSFYSMGKSRQAISYQNDKTFFNSYKNIFYNVNLELTKMISTINHSRLTHDVTGNILSISATHVANLHFIPSTLSKTLMIIDGHNAVHGLTPRTVSGLLLSAAVFSVYGNTKMKNFFDKKISTLTSFIINLPREDWNAFEPIDLLYLLRSEYVLKKKYPERFKGANVIPVIENVLKCCSLWKSMTPKIAILLHQYSCDLMLFGIVADFMKQISTRSKPFSAPITKQDAIYLMSSFGGLSQTSRKRNENTLNPIHSTQYVERLCEIIAMSKNPLRNYDICVLCVALVRTKTRHAPLLMHLCSNAVFNVNSNQSMIATLAWLAVKLKLASGFWSMFIEKLNSSNGLLTVHFFSIVTWAILCGAPKMYSQVRDIHRTRTDIISFTLSLAIPPLWAAANSGVQSPFLTELAHKFNESDTNGIIIKQYLKCGTHTPEFKDVPPVIVPEGNFPLELEFDRFNVDTVR